MIMIKGSMKLLKKLREERFLFSWYVFGKYMSIYDNHCRSDIEIAVFWPYNEDVVHQACYELCLGDPKNIFPVFRSTGNVIAAFITYLLSSCTNHDSMITKLPQDFTIHTFDVVIPLWKPRHSQPRLGTTVTEELPDAQLLSSLSFSFLSRPGWGWNLP